MIVKNLAEIKRKLAQCEQNSDRTAGSVQLVAVSKTKPMALIQEAWQAGQTHFGENRVQELVDKYPQLPNAKWHMIGGLQRNKVKYIAHFIHLIHSVDSERLLKEIDKQAAKSERQVACLLQLNISDETQKGGFQEAQIEDLLQRIEDFPHVKIQGLMGMAAFTADKEAIQSQFERLQLAAQRFSALGGPQISMAELSMGMSGDYPIAIAQGATLVRIGSAIFGSRQAST